LRSDGPFEAVQSLRPVQRLNIFRGLSLTAVKEANPDAGRLASLSQSPEAHSMNKSLLSLALSSVLLIGFTPSAHAYQAGDWVARVGVGQVNPKSDNGTLAGTLNLDISSDVKPTLALSYFMTDHVAAQVLAAWPFEHDYDLNGARSGTFKHLPPTVTFQYHFNPTGPVNFYVGAGLNYTFVYDEKIAIPGSKLRLDNSFGLAAELGMEYFLNDNWSLGAQLWWVNIDSDASLDGANIGTAHVDPIVFGIDLAYKF
jgi:outer membrane protein